MTITLPPEQERLVKQALDTRAYHSPEGDAGVMTGVSNSAWPNSTISC
jgi:hypothetical protein